jgi:hypothetical protein
VAGVRAGVPGESRPVASQCAPGRRRRCRSGGRQSGEGERGWGRRSGITGCCAAVRSGDGAGIEGGMVGAHPTHLRWQTNPPDFGCFP